MGPDWRDWLLVAGAAAFVAIALALVIARPHEATGWLCLGFFGLCLAIAVATLRSKRRALRQARDPALTVHIVGGQEITASSRRIVGASLAMVLVAALAAGLGGALGAGFLLACGLLGLLGLAALVALQRGYIGRSSLCFTPEALWLSTGRLRYPVAWDNIAAVDLALTYEQPWLRIGVHDLDAVLAAVQPPAARPGAARSFAANRALADADIVALPRLYQVDEVVLLRAVERYAGDPGARAELRPRPALTDEPDVPEDM